MEKITPEYKNTKGKSNLLNLSLSLSLSLSHTHTHTVLQFITYCKNEKIRNQSSAKKSMNL
jgi:hypothetical protein